MTSRAAHGEAHKRFDVEEMGRSARIYIDVALAHLSTRAQRQIWKAAHFGINYGLASPRYIWNIYRE